MPKGVEVRVADDETARRSMLKRSIGLQPGRLCGRLHRRFSSVPAAAKARLGAVPSSSSRVAIVYGTFASETSAEDAEIMQDYAMRNKLDLLMQVTGGDEFDFDSLASCSHLVLSTSSWCGQALLCPNPDPDPNLTTGLAMALALARPQPGSKQARPASAQLA